MRHIQKESTSGFRLKLILQIDYSLALNMLIHKGVQWTVLI